MKALMVCALVAFALPAQADTIAITGAKILTLGYLGDYDEGIIVIDDGIVTAIGADIDVPADARVIAAHGKIITPGIFDPMSYLGLTEISLVNETVDGAQRGGRYTAAFDVATAINPLSTLIPINRIEGVTGAMVAPHAAGEEASAISGLGAVIHLGDAETFLVKPRAALIAHFGETGAQLASGSRVAATLALREALDDARDFALYRDAYDAGERREYALGRFDLEALQSVLDGSIPLIATVHRASDILRLLEMARAQRIDIIINGGAEAWMVAEQLASDDIAVIMDPTRNLPEAFEQLNATLESAARLQAAGVRVAFSSTDSHNSRNIRQIAGNAVAHGMPWHEALRSITVVPAGLYDTVIGGALETGKPADLVLWSDDPLDVMSFADMVFINGREIPMRSRQTLLRDRYLELRPAMPHAYPRP